MALRALMLNKEIGDKKAKYAEINNADVEFEQREAALADAINEALTDEEKKTVADSIDAFTTEKEEHERAKAALVKEIEDLERELAEIEAAVPAPETKEERKVETMENMEIRNTKAYINAYANYIKTEDDTEVRSLLTENVSGTVPVPEFVEAKIRQAWENSGILSLVRKSYLKGNLKVGFEISSTGAAAHTEGGDPINEEELVLGIVELKPVSIKKWIGISDEAYDLNGEEFLDYVYDEITYKIAQFAGETILDAIMDAPTTSTSTAPAVAEIVGTPSYGIVASAIAQLSDQAANPVLVMTKGTWAQFKAAQYAGSYGADIFEGLPVVFSSYLSDYAAGLGNKTWLIVGDFGAGALANFPNGDEIKLRFDDKTLMTSDIIRVLGRMYVALGIVAPNAFCRVVEDDE